MSEICPICKQDRIWFTNENIPILKLPCNHQICLLCNNELSKKIAKKDKGKK